MATLFGSLQLWPHFVGRPLFSGLHRHHPAVCGFPQFSELQCYQRCPLFAIILPSVLQYNFFRPSVWSCQSVCSGCVPFALLNTTSVNIAETAFNHTFQEPWVGTLNKDNIWKWIDDFLMLASWASISMIPLCAEEVGYVMVLLHYDTVT